MPECEKCGDNGFIPADQDHDIPCECSKGLAMMFNVEGIKGKVAGTEVRRYFLKDSPERIILDSNKPKYASGLPGRRKNRKKKEKSS